MRKTRHSISLILVSLVSFTLLNGCSSVFSQMKWGLLQEHTSASLIVLAPNSKICISSDNQSVGESIAKAIKVWAKEINRDSYLTVETTCSGQADLRMSARLTDQSSCPTAQTYPSLGQIEYSSGYTSFEVMLHEVGHNWGLCDQYDGVNNCTDWLEGHTNNDKVGTSVMGYNRVATLTQDDIDGVKYIANLSTIAANQTWKNFLQNNGSSSSDSNTDTSSNSSTNTSTSPSFNTGNSEVDDALNSFNNIYN